MRVALGQGERLALAAEVGSDVPLFLVGGAVIGTGRGEIVEAVQDLPSTVCLVVAPGVGVSTPAAFRAWDAKRQLLVYSGQLLVGEQKQGAGVMDGTSGVAGPGVEEAGAVAGVGFVQPIEMDGIGGLLAQAGLTSQPLGIH